MKDYSCQNKKAWEYNAYDFWTKADGSPAERARKDLENPKGMLKKYAGYFEKDILMWFSWKAAYCTIFMTWMNLCKSCLVC